MEKFFSGDSDRKIESPYIFFFVLLLFIVSLILIYKGLTNYKNKSATSKTEVSQEELYQEDVSLSDYFKESSFDEDRDEEFLKNDPFKDVCAQTSGDGLPSVSSNTVCIR